MRKIIIKLITLFVLSLTSTVFFSCQTCTLQKNIQKSEMPDSKPGMYINRGLNFSVSYPENWTTSTEHLTPNVVFKVAGPPGTGDLAVSISDLRKGDTLKTVTYAFPAIIKSLFPDSDEHKIIYQKKKLLEDGTPSMEFDIQWLREEGQKPLNTSFILNFKKKRVICVSATTYNPPVTSMLKLITRSLRFYSN